MANEDVKMREYEWERVKGSLRLVVRATTPDIYHYSMLHCRITVLPFYQFYFAFHVGCHIPIFIVVFITSYEVFSNYLLIKMEIYDHKILILWCTVFLY